jgi:hypothetical protein
MDYDLEDMEASNPDIDTPKRLRRAETKELVSSLEETMDEEERELVTLELQRRGEYDPMEGIDDAGVIEREPTLLEKTEERVDRVRRSEGYEKTKGVMGKVAKATKSGWGSYNQWRQGRKQKIENYFGKFAGGKPKNKSTGGKKAMPNFLGTGKSKFKLGGKAKKRKWY